MYVIINTAKEVMIMGNLLRQSVWEYERLLKKIKNKNITEDTLTSIYRKLNDIEDGIEYIINNYELNKRTVLHWQETKEKRFA